MSIMARQPSTPGTRATATIRLAGLTGRRLRRRATSAVHPASARAEPASARSARTREAFTGARRSLRCHPRPSRRPQLDSGLAGKFVRDVSGRAATGPLMRGGPRAAHRTRLENSEGAMRVLIAGDRGFVGVPAAPFRRAARHGSAANERSAPAHGRAARIQR